MKRKLLIVLCFTLLLAACSNGKGTATPTVSSNAVMTAVKQTVDANSTTMAALTPSATLPPTATNTPAESATPLQSPTNLFTATNPATATSSLADKAVLASQSVPDNTKVAAGSTFKVTWTFTNLGTTTWTTDYAAKFWSDSLMGESASVSFPGSVAPNGTLSLTMTFTAPSTAGTAKSSWWLQNPQGQNFYPFYVIVDVVGTSSSSSTSTATSTIEVSASSTPTP